jgi:hypothetical protein
MFDWLFGSKDKIRKSQKYSPEQMQAFQQLFSSLTGGGGAFSDVFGEFDPTATQQMFEQGFVEPSMRNFNQRVIPEIMQSFADQGASSGLSNSLASAGRDLQSNLGSQLSQLLYSAQLQNQQNRMGGLGMLMGAQPNQQYIQQGSSGFIPSWLQGFGSGFGKSFGGW